MFILFYGHRILWIDNDGYVHEHFVDFKFKHKMLQIKNCLDLKLVEALPTKNTKLKSPTNRNCFTVNIGVRSGAAGAASAAPIFWLVAVLGPRFLYSRVVCFITQKIAYPVVQVLPNSNGSYNFKLLTRVDPIML